MHLLDMITTCTGLRPKATINKQINIRSALTSADLFILINYSLCIYLVEKRGGKSDKFEEDLISM